MNLLTNYKLINDTFRSLSEEVLVNGEPQQAIVATSYLGMEEKRHINSLEPLRRGDYIEHRGKTYLVVEEVETPRHNKYRATMRYCDYSFTVRDYLGRQDTGRRDFQGRPIYEDIYSDPYEIYGCMKQWERSLDQSFPINMMQVTFFVDVQDNEKNREQFVVDNVYEIKGRNMQVALLDRSQEGLLGVLFIRTGTSAPY